MGFKYILCLVTFLVVEKSNAFSIKPYLEKCGGKIYSKCDAADLNQKTIFEEARSEAVKDGKRLMVVYGADWCPSCRAFSEMLAKDSNVAKLYEQFVLVEINGDLASAKALTKELKISMGGYPQAFLFSPSPLEFRQQFFPSRASNVEDLLAMIGVASKEPTEAPSSLGNVHLSTLEKPMVLTDDYGSSAFISHPTTEAERYVNQGIAALHVFQYVDAYRSFREAQRRDSALVSASLGLILTLFNFRDWDSEFLIDAEFVKIETLAKTRELTSSEKAWINFARAVYISNKSNYVKPPGVEITSLAECYESIRESDPTNLDGIALATWASWGALDSLSAINILEDILKVKPDLIGAHHYLLHMAERKSDARMAAMHATRLRDLAPGSAHAVHMYGHTLPQQGLWKEAVEAFSRADQIHQAWSLKQGIELNQDWHYSHNLDLLAAAYLGGGDFANARAVWERSGSDYRAVRHRAELAVVTMNKEDALKYLDEPSVKFWIDTASLKNEVEFSLEKAHQTKLGEEELAVLFGRIVGASLKSNPDKALSSDIQQYFFSHFKKGGFDGWSNGYLELLRVKRIAEILSLNWLVDDLKTIEMNVQTGSLCGASDSEKSHVRCVP